MDDGSGSALDPVVLNIWPSCNECLSWSSDGELAIAAGEFVYILTPKQSSKAGSQSRPGAIGLRQWHSTRVRTNVFTLQEWPNQHPAPFRTFSIGEEQTMSTVDGLAWSSPGIGPHKRSVLAVLTSNHILSLWESNGTIGEWKRVVVVNQSLGDYFGRVNEAGKDIYRAKRRIRTFAWSPAYRSVEADDGRILKSKWGVVHLAVAGDDELVTILRVANGRRRNRIDRGVEAICHVEIPTKVAIGGPPHAGSLFHKAMMSKSPISSLSWSSLDGESSESFIEVTQRSQFSFIKVQASLQPAGGSFIDALEHSLRLDVAHWENPGQENYCREFQSQPASENEELNRQVEEARMTFDSSHTLDGNSIVRKWGFASSGIHDAACITIHPSDMVEYTTGSMERCTLLFAKRIEALEGSYPSTTATTSPTNVLFKVTSWILGASIQVLPLSPLDRYLLGIAASFAGQSDNEPLRQKAATVSCQLRETLESHIEHEDMDVDEPALIDSLTASDMEKCLICEALIAFNENDLSTARCETGHQYSMFSSELSPSCLLTTTSTMQFVSACNSRAGNIQILFSV